MTRDGNSPNGENLEESPHRQLRMRDVTDRTTLSPQTIHRMIGSGDFPLGVLDGGCRLWHVRSIKSWTWCRAQASWARRRLTDDPVFEPWSPEMERDDVPEVRLVKRVEALALVGLAKTTFYTRNLGPSRWSEESALREIQRQRLPYVPTPAPIQITLMRAAFIADELERYIQFRTEVLGPDGLDQAEVAARLEADPAHAAAGVI